MKPTYHSVGGTRSGHTAIAAPAPRLARGALLVFALCASHARASTPETPPPPLETAATAAALLDVARVRLDVGDAEGARVVLREALARADVDADAATYLMGLAWERDGDPSQAVALYDRGLAAWPASPLTPDRLFRRAEALAALGRPEEALDTLARLARDGLDPSDVAKVTLAEGALWIETGRTRVGLRALADVLPTLAPDQLAVYQARARAMLARTLADEAAALHFRVGDRRQARRLEARARLIRRIEQEVAAVAALDEPEWVLDGVLTYGGALEALAADLEASRRPRRLTPAQRAIYDEEVGKRIDTLRVKAARTYALGVDLVDRVAWSGPRADAVRARHTELVSEIGLP